MTKYIAIFEVEDDCNIKTIDAEVSYTYESNGTYYGMREGIEFAKEKTGRWIKTPKAVMGEGYMWYCDKCEHQVYQDSSRPYPSEKYCPNCGARMVSE